MSITTNIEYTGSTFSTSQQFTLTTIGTGFTVADGGGVTDHGALTGLADDDHTQYLNNARGDARYPTLTDYAADLIDLNLAIDGKFDAPTGDTTQYIAGDGTIIAFPVAGQAGTLVRLVRNETGTTLTKGTVIYLNGASGNKPLALRAIANSEAASDRTFGIVQADISNNSNGYCVVNGDLGGLNTASLTEGAILYLSDSVAGGSTTTPPVAPNHIVVLGIVTRSHATQGQFDVAIQNGFELDDLHDLSITSAADKDILSYELSTGLWKNKQLTSSDVSGLDTQLSNKQPLSNILTNSTSSFTTAQESKLAGIAAGAEVNVNSDWNASSGDAQILNKPSTFTPSAHSHVISDVTGLQTALDGKEPTIIAGTTAQYYRGDKTFQTLNKAAVGLSNVDNTSDANKPVSSATQSALDAKQPLATVLTNTTASFTTAQETKLSGIQTGAEVNVNADWNSVSGDSQILNKPSTFTPSAHTHTSSEITDLAETVQDIVAAQLVEGSNITLTYNDAAGTLTIDAAGGGSVGSVTSTVDFGSTFTDSAQVVVTGQSWVTLSSKISTQVLCGVGVDPLEIALLDFKIVVSDLVAGVGFTLTAYSMPQARGTYSIMCVGV
jgi:hypothetical protein